MDTPLDPPPPPPEAVLLEAARKARRLTPAQAARLAGVSVSLWRQYENGYATPAKDLRVEKSAPPDTYARMAYPLGITGDMVRKQAPLRQDAATELDKLAAGGPPPQQAAQPPRPVTNFGSRQPRILHEGIDEARLAPYLQRVRGALADATVRYGLAYSGAQAFSAEEFGTDAEQFAGLWDRFATTPEDADETARLIAVLLQTADEARDPGKRVSQVYNGRTP
jgi:hypothetical protein